MVHLRILLVLVVITTVVTIPSTTLPGGVDLPMLIMGDGASWGRPSNFTAWIQLVGSGHHNTINVQGRDRHCVGLWPVRRGSAYSHTWVLCDDTLTDCCGGDESCGCGFDYKNPLFRVRWRERAYECDDETFMVWKVMEAAKRAGKAKAIGVSNFIAADLAALKEAGITEPIAANQCHFTVGQIDNATISWCKQNNVVLESYGTLHGPVPTNHPVIAAVAARNNKSDAAVVLKYVSQHGISIVTASDSTEYDVEDAAIFDWTLSVEDMAALDSVQGGAKLSCSDCYAQPCRTCQDAIKSAGCTDFISQYDHSGCMACVRNLTASSAAKVEAVCNDDFVFKACW